MLRVGVGVADVVASHFCAAHGQSLILPARPPSAFFHPLDPLSLSLSLSDSHPFRFQGQLLSRGTTLSLDDDNDEGAAAMPDDDEDDDDEFPSPTSSRASSAPTELRPELDQWGSFASSSAHLQAVKTLKKHASF